MASNLAQIRNNKDFWREIGELAHARYLKTCQVSHGESFVRYMVNSFTDKLLFILELLPDHQCCKKCQKVNCKEKMGHEVSASFIAERRKKQ